MDITQILSILRSSGLNVLGADSTYIWISDPTCFTQSAVDFINNIAWPILAVITAFMLLGWGIAMIRGARVDIMKNMKNLVLIFGILSAAWPIADAIYGSDVTRLQCRKVGIPIAKVQEALASRDSRLTAFDPNNIYENINIDDSGAVATKDAKDGTDEKKDDAPARTPVDISQISGVVSVAGNAYNGHIYGGMCTSESASRVFSNQSYTTNQFAETDAPFNKAMDIIFRAEGGYSNNPFDAGGETKYGISSRANPDIDVKNITRADAEQIAYDRYYKRYGIDKLPDAIRGDVFQIGWGTGPKVAIRQFQEILGVPKTGTVDNATITAAQNYTGDLHGQVMDKYQQYLNQIVERKPSQKIFQRGWTNRVELMRSNGCHSS